MKENIPSLIAFCNKAISSYYKKDFPRDLDEFTPVDKNNQEVIDTIYEMYLILKNQETDKRQWLMLAVKYYFVITVIEYYVDCPLFHGKTIEYMVDFSVNPSLSIFRKRMMGFSSIPYSMPKFKLQTCLNFEKRR